MARNFDSWRQRREQRRQQKWDRLNDRFEEVPRKINELRLRLHRSPNGLALGVFRGIAESLGYCVGKTRFIGVIALLVLSSSVGASGFRVSLLVAGFFYLLAAVLMRGPETVGRRSDDPAGPSHQPEMPPPYPPRASARPAAVPYYQAARAPRVDFAALDRQLDGLNRRIQRMEGIVTDRHYDWDRRMEG